MSTNQHNLPSVAIAEAQRQQDGSSTGGVAGGVSVFSRREAYAHGLVVDVTSAAQACGFTNRVAFSTQVWTVIMPRLFRDGDTITAAMHEVLHLAWAALRYDARRNGGREVQFCAQGSNGALVWLKVRIMSLDDGTEELTVMGKDEI